MTIPGGSWLITGGTGSFGQAFVSRLLEEEGPERIVVYSRSEHLQEQMQRAMKDPFERVRYFVGDVRDRNRLALALRGVDTVIHAAALKIVPSCEYNPTEAVQTNVFGAVNVVEAALQSHCVERVVALSTDKACSPINLYGATKLVAERVFLAANDFGGRTVKFGVVRYGNIAGSKGSVIPLWRGQMERGEPVTITKPAMTRFWMTLPGAVQLVLDALAAGPQPHVRIPKLRSYQVGALAEALTRKAHPTLVVGIRPGEKWHESLISEDESAWAHDEGDHWVLDPFSLPRPSPPVPYTSRDSEWLSVDELAELLEDVP